jgi:hypothetical protein
VSTAKAAGREGNKKSEKKEEKSDTDLSEKQGSIGKDISSRI